MVVRTSLRTEMYASARLLLLAALPTLAGVGGWCADGEVVSVTEGVGPAFAPHQATSIVAPLGHAVTLDCRVLRLGDKSVSWVRSRDLQILTHAGAVFTADSRVSATSAAEGSTVSRHSLRIERLRASDQGRYECQVNTEPKLSLFFNLTVVDEVVPSVIVSAIGTSIVTAVVGGSATLACEARYSPTPQRLLLPPLDIRWQRADELISLQGGRGGVSLDTERWVSRAVSRMTLADLTPADAGRYTCSAAGMAVDLMLHVIDTEEESAAMQRDEAASSATRALAGCAYAHLCPEVCHVLCTALYAAVILRQAFIL